MDGSIGAAERRPSAVRPGSAWATSGRPPCRRSRL